MSSWFGTNWFQMKISAHKPEKALMFFALCSIILSPTTLLFIFLLPCMHAGAKMAKDSLLTRNTTWNFVQKNPILITSLTGCLSPSIHLCISLPLLSCFLPVTLRRTPGLWRCRPSGRKQATPSLLLFFFHNLLFMSDRPPPDKWLPYGERQGKGRKGKLSLYRCEYLWRRLHILGVVSHCIEMFTLCKL